MSAGVKVEFVPLPGVLVIAVAIITASYVAATELQKRWFYARMR